MDLELEMARRVRRHMVTSLAGVMSAIGLMVLGGALARALFGANVPGWFAVGPLLAIMMIPAIGFWSTFHNLRCPACNGLVAFQVSYQTSPFGGGGTGNCRHCGAHVFGDLIRRRARRLIFVGFAVGIGLGVVGAVLNVITHMHH